MHGRDSVCVCEWIWLRAKNRLHTNTSAAYEIAATTWMRMGHNNSSHSSSGSSKEQINFGKKRREQRGEELNCKSKFQEPSLRFVVFFAALSAWRRLRHNNNNNNKSVQKKAFEILLRARAQKPIGKGRCGLRLPDSVSVCVFVTLRAVLGKMRIQRYPQGEVGERDETCN